MIKNNIPVISTNVNMNMIYRRVISEVGNEFPAFLIFENQPYDVMRYRMPDGRSILYFNNCGNICEKIISEMKYPKAKTVEAPDFMIHSLKNDDVASLYAVAALISEMLKVPCPQIEYRDDLSDNCAQLICERNHVVLAAVPREHIGFMVRNIAHAIRRLWQHTYHPEYSESYVDPVDDIDAYLNCIAEIDAEAWASKLFLEVLGIDYIADCGEEYACGNVKVKERILRLRETIKLNKEYVYRLKWFFNVL